MDHIFWPHNYQPGSPDNYAWLFDDVYVDCVRILTQESQIGEPDKKKASELPNPMLNAHQEWITGFANASKSQSIFSEK